MRKELFGIPITNISYKDFIEESIQKMNSYSCFLNAHMVYEHFYNPYFRNVLKNAHYVLPDGISILQALRLVCGVNQSRVAGNDVIFSLIQKAQNENLRVFMIGSTEIVLEKISLILYSKNIIHMLISPPFVPIEKFDFESQAKKINTFSPDLVLVGLGCPKQEIWMNKMSDKISAPMYGLGGAFSLYAGVDTRAPKWIRDIGMEWAYRLSLEPKRLWKRYLITNSFFIWLFILEYFRRRFVNRSFPSLF